MELLELIEKMDVEISELKKAVDTIAKPKDLEEYISGLGLEVYEDGTVVGMDVKIWDFLAGL